MRPQATAWTPSLLGRQLLPKDHSVTVTELFSLKQLGVVDWAILQPSEATWNSSRTGIFTLLAGPVRTIVRVRPGREDLSWASGLAHPGDLEYSLSSLGPQFLLP